MLTTARFKLFFCTAALAAGVCLATGCETAPKQSENRSFSGTRASGDARPAPRQPGGAPAAVPNDPESMLRPAGQLMTTRVRAGVLPRGVIPYDDLTLPVVSPDGRFIATQTGVPPTWPTILAEHDALPPIASRIEIYNIEGRTPQFVASPDMPLLLGRNADMHGFLVESPQEDGSRWIGHVAWTTGLLTWLVDDEFVNAFAVLGPDGRLAWCRRSVDENNFELVAHHRDSTWTIPSQGESWLMPMWCGTRAGGFALFAFALRAGYLDVAFIPAIESANARQTMRRFTIGEEVTVFSAYQAVSAQTNSVTGFTEEIVFFHPRSWRMAVWRPLTARGPVVVPGERSFAALIASVAGESSDGRLAIVCTEKSLTVQNINNVRDRAELIAGMLLPRATSSAEWPYLLLSPSDGHIGLTSLTLLPAEDRAMAR
ncbi:MAG TPA: hypothetical protein PK400_10730 [Phycisphaerales bacterium]|nr:hypothetical protein [Phycisphaerales bacterium]HRQ75062.1 hypothetical protein [Phycisphaerales bacterium]